MTPPPQPEQNALFDEPLAPADAPAAEPTAPRPARRPRAGVEATAVGDATRTLAAALPHGLHLGTSSWHFPGWAGLVWGGDYAEATLSKHGLVAYARHPLLRSVSLDRAFYRPSPPPSTRAMPPRCRRTSASSSRRLRWCATRRCAPKTAAAVRPTRPS
ncbi:hypothetical protein [Ottowia beijingensis]|uniref:hypothetical protein n=1 Tax=Ottowia beijingensis TaxID=1207057 RepID=UPI002803D6E2|nr:hypothetical protein [Ottowia beijingensis]